jgi:acetyl esterase/lipase
LLLKRYTLPIVHRHSFFSEFQHFSVSVYFFNLNLNLKIIKFRIILILSIPLILFSCAKNVEKALDPANNNFRLGQGSEIDSLEYYANLGSPTRELTKYLKNGGRLPVTQLMRDLRHISPTPKLNSGYPYACGDESYPLIITAPPGYDPASRYGNLSGNPFYIYDAFNNPINAIGIYGSDDRNGYYVYSPLSSNENSPIVVLIHGGGWFSGPNPDYVNGWVFPYSDNPSSTNLVKDLLNAGYVVVVPLYRLAKYGKDSTEIISNTITWDEQIDDIDDAINHVRDNFPECLNFNANSIQVLGESAGGHLALMWAYTRTTISSSYIKSAITCYAPTNLQQYGEYLRDRPTKYYCGNSYYSICGNYILPNLYPFYFYFLFTNQYAVYNSSSTFDCIPGVTCINTPPAPLNDFRVIDSTYNLIQSASATLISNPISSSLLNDFSPKHTLSSGRIIPTFIMHSDAGSDLLVPYNQATDGMSSKLSSTGGLIATLTTNNASVSYDYPNETNKHLIKQFPGANHSWDNTTSSTKDSIRTNIITWLNGHK